MSSARLLFTGVLILGSACVSATPPPAPVAAPVVVRKRVPPPVARPEAQFVDDLDRGIQSRFRDVRPADIEVGRLGVSRVGSLQPQRLPRGILHRELKKEHETIRDLTNAGWDSAIYVVEGTNRGTDTGEVFGPIVSTESIWLRFPDSSGIRELAARAMASKATERGSVSGTALEARPVLASEAMCLRCHRRDRVGDPLGAVVYAFRTAPLLGDASR